MLKDIQISDIIAILTGLLVVAEVIVNLTPSTKDNSILLKIKTVIGLLAPNKVAGDNKAVFDVKTIIKDKFKK